MDILFYNFPFFNSLIILLAVILAYNSFSVIYWFGLGFLFLLQFSPSFGLITIYLLIATIFSIKSLREKIITTQIIKIITKLKLIPKISDTEKTALKSGTVWIDGELFSGNPNFNVIFSQKYPKLNKEEKSFLENEVENVCKMCVDEEIYKNKDLSPEVWQYLKDNKFFGMIIPKKYGGLGFSAFAHSEIIQKLASRSVPLAITVMVPNSLGPAELLLEYGTKRQQDHYLPRLANGQEVPCFALTEPLAGSDATSISSEGIIFKDEDGTIKIRLNWNKRYITLGAVATVIGLAFKLKDPENIMGKGEDIGITCALIDNKLKGVKQGRRHDPLSTPFINSPINGENVIIGIESIIGEENGLGKGWKMLMECLAAGRAISLPSTSIGGSKLTARVVTAYSVIREQFGLSIGKFEAVEKVIAQIISKTYQLDAMRIFSASAVDQGSKPAVISAIAKYHSTEIFRKIINDGMDIIAGSGIIRGKRNLLANGYFSAPISITVEGANIMTRGLIHFGQGAIMCHPFVYKEFEALENNDIRAFDRAVFSHLSHFIKNKIRFLILFLTRGYLHKPVSKGIITNYERKLAWASAHFAFLADIAIIKFGGNLKRKEKINGRFGDILSAMYMIACVLNKFKSENKKDQNELLEYAMRDLFNQINDAFDGIWQNLFTGWAKIIITPLTFVFKINRFFCPAKDSLETQIVKKYLKNGDLRDDLTSGIFIPNDTNEALGRLENALKLFEESEDIIIKIKNAVKDNILPSKNPSNLLDLALEKNIINKKEFDTAINAKIAAQDAVQVDEYSISEYKNL